MADVIDFATPEEKVYRHFVRESCPDRPTREIIDDLKPLRMLGEEDAVARGVLFAELAVKSERGTS